MSARTPFAYISVAGCCILLHNVVMIGANRASVALGPAVLLSFFVVASAGYVLHSLFTFRQPLALKGFARYAIAMSANIPLAFVTTWFWYKVVGLPMTIASPIASGCMLALNFVLGRWAIAAPSLRSVPSR